MQDDRAENSPKNHLDPLRLSDRIIVLPIVHGCVQSEIAVSRWLLDHQVDCLAIPLPHSFAASVRDAILQLPHPSIVIQRPDGNDSLPFVTEWHPEADANETNENALSTATYVPIDPSQAVISAIRHAMGEHIPTHFIDMETSELEPMTAVMPDTYALQTLSLERFATAALPGIPKPQSEQAVRRMRHMAKKLLQLESQFSNVVAICSLQQWPWLRAAYHIPPEDLPEGDEVSPPETYRVSPRSLTFLFGELPFITALHEKARQEWSPEGDVSIDGVKQLLISSREAYLKDLGKRARKVTPKILGQCLKYIRNMTLIERRIRPDLFTICTACQQILGDQFAMNLVETAQEYDAAEGPVDDSIFVSEKPVGLGIDQIRLPDGEIAELVCRLPGHPVSWRTISLKRRPDKDEFDSWSSRWNPIGQCSWPPEDVMIESFRSRVFDNARAIMGADLAQSEKFSTSMKDGLDIRETLRNWHDGDIYVKVMPPTVGNLDAAIMLFDSPADPRDYPWRATWFAEHENESTLAFFATDYRKELIGPGVAAATYGGSMFLFPPRPIHDIWVDPRFNFTDSLEERLIAAACFHSKSRQVALLSWLPPGAGWRRLAKRFHKTLVHVPMGKFNEPMIQQLRNFHVLNGHEVRSFAANYIRRP